MPGQYDGIFDNDSLPGVYYCKVTPQNPDYRAYISTFTFTRAESNLDINILDSDFQVNKTNKLLISISNPYSYSINDARLIISSSGLISNKKEKKITIPAGSTLYEEVLIGNTGIGDYNILIMVTKETQLLGMTMDTLKLQPEKKFGLDVRLNESMKMFWSDQVNAISVDLVVINTGDFTENISINITQQPYTTISYEKQHSLLKGEKRIIPIEVTTIPSDQDVYIETPIEVEITETGESKSLNYSLLLVKPKPIITVEPKLIVTEIDPKGTQTINITLMETGGREDAIDITTTVTWLNNKSGPIINIPQVSITKSTSKNSPITIMANNSAEGTYGAVLKFQAQSNATASLQVEVEVTSGEVHDSYSIQLYTGWNLISLPLTPEDTDVLNVLSSVMGNWNSVWSYEGGNWKRYDLTGPDFLNDLTVVEPGKGYWIDMKSDDTLYVSGSEPTVKSIPLSAGWNLVGYNSLNSMPTTSAMNSVAGNWNSVWSYEAGNWKRYDLTGPDFLNDLTTMEPGKGYWIDMKSSDTWSLGA